MSCAPTKSLCEGCQSHPPKGNSKLCMICSGWKPELDDIASVNARYRVISTRRDPWGEAERLRQMTLACAEGKRVLIVATSVAQRNHTTARMIRLAGVTNVFRWKRDGLLNFKIV